MTTLREAATMALEALEQSETFVPYEGFGMARREAERKHQAAITALKAALAEPVQEPVAWRFEARHIDSAWAAAVTLKHPGAEGVYMRNVTPLYTAPPQRKPLTDEEIKACEKQAMVNGALPFEQRVFFARAIERAHGIV